MSEFEDNLWREVVRVHGDDLAHARPDTRGSGWWPHGRLVAGTTAATVAAVGAGVVLLLGTAAGPPAFALTRSRDGTVTVLFAAHTGLTPSQLARMNRALAALSARTGRAETLVETPSGLRVRCPDGQLVGVSTMTVSVSTSPAPTGNTGAGNTGSANTVVPTYRQRPASGISWRCPATNAGNTGNTGAGNTGTG